MSTTYESGEVFEPAAGAGPDEAPGYDTTEGRVFTVSGGDWDTITLDPSVANERIVVNMGPQHPSTHGVLRLILELEGETVQEARCGIGYLHTGIEKNLEYRTWTQGMTFVTRMDYLSSFFNETAYCLAVEKLLGITDDIPERATVIRVILMELNRICSHLVCLATGGLELGALTAMTFGFRERELILDIFELVTGLRMNHAYIRPGGLAQDLPEKDDLGQDMRTRIQWTIDQLRSTVQGHLEPAGRQHHLDGPHLGHRLPGPHRLHGPGRHRPDPAGHRLPWDARKDMPYCGYERYEFEVPTQDTADAYGRFLIRLAEMEQSLNIVEQALEYLKPGPGDGRRPEDRLAGAAGDRHRRHGQLPGPHPPDHGHLDGGPDPPLQAGDRGLQRAGRARSTRCSRPRAASSACTWCRTAGPSPTACTSAIPASTTCSRWPPCARAARWPTSSPRSPASTP